MDDSYSSTISTGPEHALIFPPGEPTFNVPYSTPIRADGERSFTLVSENQPSILPSSDETHVQQAAYLKELRPRQKRKLNNLKCSYCRRDKKPCSPANRIWPGQKCKHCEIKGLPCSEATQSRLGRPPNSQTPDPKSDLVVPQTVDDSSPSADAIDADYIKLMNRISYGQMLTASLDTLKRLKTNLIKVFDKEMMFTDYWDEASGLQDCRDFEEFVKSYHRDNVLQRFSEQNFQVPASSQAISSALLASALSPRFAEVQGKYNDHDIKMLKAHVSSLSSSGFLGHAMTLQTALVTRAVRYNPYHFDEDEKWDTLTKLKDSFRQVVLQILRDVAFSEGWPMKIPRILMCNPLSIPEDLVLVISESWELHRFRDANWEIDCLGRTLLQITLDEDRYFFFKEYSLREEQDIIGRSGFHAICEKNKLLDRLGGRFARPAVLPTDMKSITQKNCAGQQLLHYAAALGDVQTSKYLLSFSGIEADCPDVLGRAPVFYAASNGHTEILVLLLDHGVNIDRNDNKGYTPLSIAVHNGHLNAIECLSEKGADINHIIPASGLTPFAQAVLQQDIDVVRLLGLHTNIDVNCKIKHEGQMRTPLTRTITDGFQKGVQYLLSREDIDVNKHDWNGRTPLYAAVAYRRVDAVRLLAAHPKTNVNLAFSLGRTALISAARSGRHEIVEILLAHPDIDVNLADTSGCTPLMEAARNGRTEVILSLLRHPEVDLGLVDSRGTTAMEHAQRRGSGEIVKILCEAMSRSGIDTVRDEESETMSNKPNPTIF